MEMAGGKYLLCSPQLMGKILNYASEDNVNV